MARAALRCPSVDDAAELNRARWDEIAALHGQDTYYDVEGFLAGQLMLSTREREQMAAAVGSVSNVDLLHVQYHFELGTLSWARLGARVTCLGFSAVAVERASSLATTVGIDARFVQADAQRLPAELAGAFDVVFASYGVLPWAARDAMVAAGMATPDDLHRWQRAIERVAADSDSALFAPRFAAAGRTASRLSG